MSSELDAAYWFLVTRLGDSWVIWNRSATERLVLLGVPVLGVYQLPADIAPGRADCKSFGVLGHQTPPTADVSEPRFSRAAHFPRCALGHMLMNVFVAPRRRL